MVPPLQGGFINLITVVTDIAPRWGVRFNSQHVGVACISMHGNIFFHPPTPRRTSFEGGGGFRFLAKMTEDDPNRQIL